MNEDRAKWFKVWINDEAYNFPELTEEAEEKLIWALGEAYYNAIKYAKGEPAKVDRMGYIAKLNYSKLKAWVDASQKKYKTMSENGKKGGAPEGNKNAKKVIELKKRIEEERAAGILKNID